MITLMFLGDGSLSVVICAAIDRVPTAAAVQFIQNSFGELSVAVAVPVLVNVASVLVSGPLLHSAFSVRLRRQVWVRWRWLQNV